MSVGRTGDGVRVVSECELLFMFVTPDSEDLAGNISESHKRAQRRRGG
jgi:hypothetical protein